MSFDDFEFESQADTQAAANNAGFNPLPKGWYVATITDGEFTTGKNDPAIRMLKLTLTVIDHPEFSGRQLYDQMITKHPTSQKAVEIAAAKAATLFVATNNIPKPKGMEDLIGKNVEVKVKVKKETEEYEAGNEISAYRPVLGDLPGEPTATKSKRSKGGEDLPF